MAPSSFPFEKHKMMAWLQTEAGKVWAARYPEAARALGSFAPDHTSQADDASSQKTTQAQLTPDPRPSEDEGQTRAERPIVVLSSGDLLGTRCGPYRLVKEIGRGGMGSVFLGERDDGLYQMQVAVKVLQNANLAHPESVERFLHEQKVMASLNHPNIAAILDGGVQDQRIPFFIMELIDGHPITEYCQEGSVDIERRIKLFIQVCEAVQFSHRNLIVHRDLKPDNILVDHRGQVKVLDFGIAKVLDLGHAMLHSPQTRTGQVLATPAYASPENLQGNPVSVASDIFSMGVILYELLTDQHPFMHGPGAALQSVFNILQADPERPSTALTKRANASGDELPCRPGQLQGDLDTICLKCLAKKPEDRYHSVDALKEDLERFLAGLPIRARDATWSYRLVKAYQRNRPVFWAALLAFGTLFAFSVSTWIQSQRIAHKNIQITEERDRAEEIAQFMQSLFLSVDPRQFRSGELSAKALLDTGVKSLRDSLNTSPQAKANLLLVVSRVYTELGQYEEAQETLDDAQQWVVKHLGEQSTSFAEVTNLRAILALRLGDYGEAHCYLDMARSWRQEGNDNEPLDLDLMSTRALVYKDQGQFEQAEWLLRQLIDDFKGIEHPTQQQTIQFAADYNNLGSLLQQKGEFDEAETCYLESLWLRQSVLEPDHPILAENHNNLGTFFQEINKPQEAELHLRKALELLQNRYDKDHLNVITVLNNLAGANKSLGAWTESERLYREVLDRLSRAFPGDSPYLAGARNNLALLLLNMEKTEEAETLLRQSLAYYREHLGPNHPHVGVVLSNLGSVALTHERWAEADDRVQQALTVLEPSLGPDHARVLKTKAMLALIAFQRGDEARYQRLWDGLLARTEASSDLQEPVQSKFLETAARIAFARKDYAEARRCVQQSLDLDLASSPALTPALGHRFALLAESCLELGDSPGAREAVHQLETCWGNMDPSLGNHIERLNALKARLSSTTATP